MTLVAKLEITFIAKVVHVKFPASLYGNVSTSFQGVIEYSLALFFNKLVVFTFLYWLPFYVKASCESVYIRTLPVGKKLCHVDE